MKRAVPFLLFAAVTVAVFWKFLLFGQTMYAMSALESQLGKPVQEPRGWFRSEYRHTRISDNLVLLALHLRIYNEGLHQGELRLWNPYLLCGLPTASDPMVHPFYPPNLLLHSIFSPDAAYELGMLLHLFFAGVAFYALLKSRGRSDAAATAGGLVWMLCGYQAMWFSTGILCGLMVFGPLAALWALQGLETRDRRRAALAGAALGLAFLGSHPHHALLFALFLTGWLVYATWKDRRSAVLQIGILLLLACGVGVVEILLRLDTIENGYRDPRYDALVLYAEPWTLSTYLSGILIGKAHFPGPGWEAEFPVYLGLSAATLALIGAWRQRRDPHVRALTLTALLALAVAFLKPLAWLFLQIPILNISPASRLLVLVGFAAAYLSAHGVDALVETPGKTWRGVAWVAVAFLIAMVVGLGPVRTSNGAAIEILIGFALAAAAAWTLTRSKPAAAALGLAALLFELLPPFIQYNYHADSSLMARRPPALEELPQDPPWRGTGILGTTATSTKSEQWGNDLVTGNNLLALYGIENVAGFEAIIPTWTVTYALAAGAALSPAGRTLQYTKLDSALLDFVGLRDVWLPSALPLPPRFRKIRDHGSVSHLENRGALPRARLAPHVRVVPSAAEAEARVRRPDYDPKWEIVIESDHPLPTVFEGEVTWKERTTDRSVLEVVAKLPSVLVVADTDYPGWEATLDGVATPILRANVAFRAIEVPVGTHRVEFRYRPAAKRQGALASAFFLLLSLAAARWWRQP